MDSNIRYEIKALAFYQMTGLLAPGKYPDPGIYPAPFKERVKAFNAWLLENSECISAMLFAVDKIMGTDNE